ncbi:ABC transporter ATP-binding protein [Maritalea sp.]|uniref:ABC transporter ATP-binding protein n=1 Tax=Maritalea sp. TaxID=2003361 RepID=UPI003EF4BCF4
MSVLLEVKDLTAGYGGVPIIEGISFDVFTNEIAVILGPNGAGKSTVLKTIFSLTTILGGSITLDGQDITARKTSKLVSMGVSVVPQSHNVFPNLTVDENLDIGTYAAPPADKVATREKILSLFPDLRDKLGQPSGELSGGQRQMVAIGRALMCEPTLLLLDEPTAGLSPAYLERIFDLLLDVRKTGVTILMVEQNARQALQIADHGHVFVTGKNFASGTGQELLADDNVRKSFLGGAAS